MVEGVVSVDIMVPGIGTTILNSLSAAIQDGVFLTKSIFL